MTLIRKAITSKFIKPDEYFSNTQQMEDVAEETADYYASDDGHGFGSSDMTAAMKSFLDGMGYQTDYVNGRLTRLDLPEIQEDDDKWIQKAVNPDHEGYCTPMTKPTCTPARKAFAKRAKAGDLEEGSAFTPLDGRDLGSKHAHAAHQAFAAQHGTDKSMEEYGQFLYAYAEGVNEAIDEVLHQGGGDWDLNPDNGDDGFLESVRQKISEYEGDGVDYDSWQSIPQANQAQFMQQAKQVGMTPQELYNQMRGEEQQDDARMGGPTTAMVDEHHLKTRQEKEAYLTNFLDVAVEGFFDELSDEELEQLYQYTEENGDLPPDYRGDAESGFVESVRQKISEYDEKFRAEVTGKGENRWSGNAMEYDTEEEAKEWLNNLANRWFGFDMSRVVPVSMPTGQPVDMENDIIYQNFRG